MSDLTQAEFISLLKKTGALMEGHFELSSGLHSPNYVQCAKILQFPQYAHRLCQTLAEKVKDRNIDVVIGPAIGGVIVSFLLGFYLNKRSIFVERKNEQLLLRRGFEIRAGEKILIVEDVITTGGTILEIVDLIKENEAVPHSLCALINRSGSLREIGGLDIVCLLSMDIPTYRKGDCPLCKDKLPILKPGSKKINKS
jgi:orotate phosphoribosyltransferase